MTEFICASCNYKFSSERDIPPKRCPYCSKMGSVRHEASAAELLSEIDEAIEEGRL